MRAVIAALAATLLLASNAVAAPPPAEDPTRATARKIAQEGLDFYDAGHYQDALDRFQKADDLVHAPTMALMAARSLDKLGRLIEASARYEALLHTVLDDAASPAFREAVSNAGKERLALAGRIPAVLIALQTEEGAQPEVMLDGAALSKIALEGKQAVDPGHHTVQARASGVTKTVRFEIKERESQTVTLDLRPLAPPASPLRTAGFITLGVGAAGLIFGGVSGGLALSKKSDLDQAGCRDNFCPTAKAGDVDGYNSLLALSSAGIIAGAVLAAGGAGLVLFAPAPKVAANGFRWSPLIGAGRLGIEGAF